MTAKQSEHTMNTIDRGYYLEAKADALTTERALPFVPAWTRTSWLSPTFGRLVSEGYGSNAAVHICITRLALAYQQPRAVVKRASDGELMPTHPLQTLLNRPNPLMSWPEVALFIATYKAIGGQCYLWKQRSAQGRLVRLWPFHVGNIEVIPAADEWIAAYVYDAGDGVKYRIEKEDIVHLKWPSVDPEQPWQALPPLRAVAREVDTDTEATRYMYALLANDATPRTVVQMPVEATLSAPEYARMKQAFQARFGGDMRGDVAILEGGAEINRLSLNMEELAFTALRKVPEARIASAFLIPVEYSGLNVGLEHSTYANVSEARAGFFEDTISQLCALDAAELTADLAPEFGGDIVIEHDFSKVIALQENEDAKYTRNIAAYKEGVQGKKETRVKLGLPDELPADDAYQGGGTSANGAVKSATPILGYHIEQGVVSKNEARAQLGLQPEDESRDNALRSLQSLLTVAQAAVNVGVPLESALTLVGLDVALPEPAAPLLLEDTTKALRPRTVKAKPLETIEQRMQRDVRRYLARQYEQAAARVEAMG